MMEAPLITEAGGGDMYAAPAAPIGPVGTGTTSGPSILPRPVFYSPLAPPVPPPILPPPPPTAIPSQPPAAPSTGGGSSGSLAPPVGSVPYDAQPGTATPAPATAGFANPWLVGAVAVGLVLALTRRRA